MTVQELIARASDSSDDDKRALARELRYALEHVAFLKGVIAGTGRALECAIPGEATALALASRIQPIIDRLAEIAGPKATA